MSDTAESEMPEPTGIVVNGTEVPFDDGELLIDACERHGVHIPRFCYHPRMEPVGMCRMCLVEVDTGRGAALQPSCMLSCSPGMIVETESDATKKAQDGVLEFLLINHPLDCPVCDKGGECPLQDNAFAYGPGESRFVEEKRHYEKPIAISDTVFLDRERCILCDRCTRFAADVAGDALIHFQDRGAQTEVNTFPDHPFASYFSGNTVQICPVGALTAKPYRFKARPWDLDEVESTSSLDSVGARIAVQSSRNQVLRYQGVDSDAVNWGWLSDKERFSFEAWNSDERLTEPKIQVGTNLEDASWSDALAAAADVLSVVDPQRVAVLGGARLTNEAQFVWTKLAKGFVGTDNVDAQLDDGLSPEFLFATPRVTIDQACEEGGTIVLLGPDPREDLGSLYLRLRRAVVDDGARLVELTPRATGLTEHAVASLRVRPGDAVDVARALVDGATTEVGGVALGDLDAARRVLEGPVTIVAGRPNLAEQAVVTEAAIAELLRLDGARLLSTLRRGNVHGALDMGMSPGWLPGRQPLGTAFDWPSTPSNRGLDCAGMLAAAARGDIDVLVLLGADPMVDVPDLALARKGVAGAKTVIAIDTFITASVGEANIVLPAAAPDEREGTFTNLEGRLSVLAQKVTPKGSARADWVIAVELADRLGFDLGIESLDDVWTELASRTTSYAGLDLEQLAAAQREGVVAEHPASGSNGDVDFDAPSNDAYSLRLIATRKMYDGGAIVSRCPSGASNTIDAHVEVHPLDLEKLGVTSGDRMKVSSPAGSVFAAVTATDDVPRGAAAVVVNQPDLDIRGLIVGDGAVTDVRIEQP